MFIFIFNIQKKYSLQLKQCKMYEISYIYFKYVLFKLKNKKLFLINDINLIPL